LINKKSVDTHRVFVGNLMGNERRHRW
jgi:hypothetical protein